MSNAHSITDRSKPVACVSTQVTRDIYQRLNERVANLGVSKGAYLRGLIETALNDSQLQRHGVNA
ncbi:MAG: hypothetical protein IT537_03285 [Hyphomicrobiales bacterium]|nr:hypothetical protein [Hyphomicrobiales bacterium]